MTPRMNDQLALQTVLQTKYNELRARNPQFSRRAFAKRIGISAGAISEILNGTRRVSVSVATRVAERLNLDPQERSELLSKFPRRSHSETADVSSRFMQLSADRFRIIGDWQHFAILTLMRLPDFRGEADWIARRLGLTPAVARASLERLERLGMIALREDGAYFAGPEIYRTTDDVPSSAVRAAHAQYLANARAALEELSPSERDFTSLMLPFDRASLPRAKELIRKFQDDFLAEFEPPAGRDAFQLCVQFFPMTKET